MAVNGGSVGIMVAFSLAVNELMLKPIHIGRFIFTPLVPAHFHPW